MTVSDSLLTHKREESKRVALAEVSTQLRLGHRCTGSCDVKVLITGTRIKERFFYRARRTRDVYALCDAESDSAVRQTHQLLGERDSLLQQAAVIKRSAKWKW